MKLPGIKRKPTRAIDVGGVIIGGDAPVVVQSMTNTQTADAAATLAQIRELTAAGAQLVRVATPTPDDTAALKQIAAESPVPIVADVHFHFERAMEAIAAGVAKIRLNPGNIQNRDEVQRVIDAAGAAGVAIRVGVNEGSVANRRDKQQLARDLTIPLEQLMLEKLTEYCEIFSCAGFDKLVLSAKSHDAVTTICVNRAISQRFDFPLHLGVTHAGTATTGAIRSAAALGALLSEGIGDTIRISYAGSPIPEVTAAKELLASLRLAPRDRAELIACPTCGRLQMDLGPIIAEVEAALQSIKTGRPIKVAMMGCVVNGPGEADNADIAICAGKGKAILYCNGQRVKNVPTDDIAKTVIEEVKKLAAKNL
ncbi:MAG: flavodoxin-dependent (E)-4-hydroxy-3-methylbut-2-enyl-diphosphate synthase [Phycisphaerae bacterium]|nr:flavodoxin-dependent (E)-4-hydroxy-3-methylbut-2-enyl-diphosphate synthase [Phycisphaerae bacterium]